MKTKCPARAVLMVMVIGFGIACAAHSWALPEGASVQAGNVNISASQNLLEIQSSSQRSIINWNSFSILHGETARFNLPSAQSAVLNRVTGGSLSEILGALQSNGQVFLINPNGIVVGQGAMIDVAALTLSTLDLPNVDFLAGGALNFSGDSQASVINLGRINAFNGDVNMFALNVENAGEINATGDVNMVAGSGLLLQPVSPKSFSVLVEGKDVVEATADVEATGAYAQAVNSGTVRAGVLGVQADSQGRVTLAAVKPQRSRVIQSGTIEGKHVSIVSKNGETQVSGNVTAKDGVGRVEILGKDVYLYSATVRAMRGDNGGDVRVGGDWQGSGTLQRAQTTKVDSKSTVSVSGTGTGNGGKAVVWADGSTYFNGKVEARGGNLGGNGGQMEVSGKKYLYFRGIADASAPNGQGGMLLLDPKNIIISSSGSAALTDVDQFGDHVGEDWTISTGTLTTALNAGTAVTLQANTDITLDADLTVNNAGGDGGALTMQAGRDIILNANITTDNGALTLKANETAANGVQAGDRDAGNGDIKSTVGTTINVGTATLTAQIVDTSNVGIIRLGDVTAGAVNIDTQDGNFTQLYEMTLSDLLTLDAGTGTATLSKNTSTYGNGMTVTSGAAWVAATGAVEIDDGAMSSLYLDTDDAVTTSGAPAVTGDAIIDGTSTTITGGAYGAIRMTSPTGNISGVTTVNLGTSNMTGNLTVTGATTITDGGDIRVLGQLSLTATDSITLNSTNNWIGDAQTDTVTLAISDNNGNIYFRNESPGDSSGPNGGAAQFAGIDVSGGTSDIELVCYGNVTQTGAFVASDLLRINAPAQDVLINNVANNAATFRLYGSDVTVQSVGNMQLGDTYITGNASLTALNAGNITDLDAGGDSGSIIIVGNTTLVAAADDITLDRADGQFGTLILTADNATITEAAAVDFGTSTITTNLTVNAGGAVTDSGDVSVGGVFTLNAATYGVTMDQNGHAFGSIDIEAATLYLEESNATAIADLDVTGTSEIISGGNITQTGGATVGGNTTFNAGANAITLNHTSNTFGTLYLTGAAVQIYEAAAMSIGDSTISNTLTAVATGAITDDGTISVTNNASFKTLNDAGAAITINNGTGNFGSVSAQTRNAADGANVAANIIITEASATDIALINTGGTLSVTSAGTMTDSGAMTVASTSSFTSSLDAAAITLDVGHTLAGAITFAPTGAGNVTLVNNTATILAASTIGGTFNLTSTGDVTQTGALAIAGTTTIDAGANAITLTTTTNTFGTLILTGGTTQIYENAVMDFGATTVGALTATSTNSITDSDQITVTGAAVFKTLNDAGGAITLDTATNAFGSIDARARNAADGADDTGAITIVETGDTSIAAIRTASTLSVSSTGVISQTGAMTVAGNASFTTSKALVGDVILGASSNIYFDGGHSIIGGDFTIDFATSGTYTVTQDTDSDLRVAGTADFSEALSVTLGNETNILNDRIDPSGSQVITQLGDVVLGNINVTGDLTVTAVTSLSSFNSEYDGAAITLNNTGNTFGAGVCLNTANSNTAVNNADGASISQDVGTTITVGGISTFTASTGGVTPNGDITLDHANSFAGAVSLTGADTILTDTNGGTQINTLDVTTFQLTSAGAITQGGSALTTTGTTTVVANSGNSDITWSNSSNSFGTLVLSGAAITVREDEAMVFGNTSATTLTATAAGAITDTGTLTVTGAGTFKTLSDAGAAITLDTAGNSFGSVDARSRDAADSANDSGNIAITETNATDLAYIATTGTLTVSSGGAITDSGALTVGSTSSFTSSLDAAAITLDTVTNALSGAITFAPTGAGNVELYNNTATILAASTIGGTFDLTSTGDVTQTGALAITGTVTIDAGANDITLDTATNTFGTLILTGDAISVRENATMVFGATTATDTLTAVATDTITDSGAMTVTNNASFKTLNNAGAVITLNDTVNFGSFSAQTRNAADGANVAADITLVEASATDVTLINTTGNLSVTSGGAITDTVGGAMTVGGTSYFGSTLDAANITLNNAAAHALSGAITFAPTGAGNVLLVNNTATILAASTIGGTFDLTSNGDVTQTGALAITGTTTVNAGANAITLTTTTNTFGTLQLTGGTTQVYENAAMNLGTSSVGALTLTATGAITDSGAVTASGATSITTRNDSGAAITLDFAGHNFGALTLASRNAANTNYSTGAIAVTEAGAMSVTSARSNSTVSLTSSGNSIDTGGGIVVGSAVTLTANSGATGITLGGIQANTGNVTLVAGTAGLTEGAGAAVIADSGTLYITSGADVSIGGGVYSYTAIGLTDVDGNATISNAGGVVFRTSDVLGNLMVTALGGNISSTGVETLTVGGTATFNAAGNNVTLNAANHTMAGIAATAEDVTITLSGGTNLAASTIGDDFTLTATGNVTDSGNVIVAGDLSVTSVGNSIVLDQTGNRFGTVSLSSATATIAEADSVALKNVTVTQAYGGNPDDGQFRVYALGGNIEDVTGGSIDVTGMAWLVSGGNATNVADPTGHQGEFAFGEAGKGGIHDVILNDNVYAAASTRIYAYNAIVMSDANYNQSHSNIANDLTLVSAGDITDSSVIMVGRNAYFGGNNVTLDGTWSIGGNVTFAANNATFYEQGDTILNASTVNNTFAVYSSGALSQLSALTAGTFLGSAGGNLDLSNAVNSISAFGSLTAGGDILARTSGNLTMNGNYNGQHITMVGAGQFNFSGSMNASNGYQIYATTQGSIGSLAGFERSNRVYPEGSDLGGLWLNIYNYNPNAGSTPSEYSSYFETGEDGYTDWYVNDDVDTGGLDLGYTVITFDGGETFIFFDDRPKKKVKENDRIGMFFTPSPNKGFIVLDTYAYQPRRLAINRDFKRYEDDFRARYVSSYEVPVEEKNAEEKEEEQKKDLKEPDLNRIVKEGNLQPW